MLFADLVATSDAVASTPARLAKIDALASSLRRLAPDEVEAAVGFLTGRPRQGRIGVGWAAVAGAEAAPASEPTLSIADVDRAVELVEAATGSGSTGARRTILAGVFERATAAEARFLRDLFTGGLRQGALEGVMVEAVARAAALPASAVRRAAMLSGDLRATAAVALSEGEGGLASVGPAVLRPLLPMLASTAASVGEALDATGAASVEWKLDGARIQVHRSGDEIRVFTRNLNDVTGRLPAIVEAVSALPLRSLILDGEAIALGDDGRPRVFQDTMSRFGTELEDRAASSDVPLAGFYFDIMHVDGRDLIDEPLRVRRDALVDAVGELRVPSIETSDPAAAEAFLAGAIAAGHEGVMVKALDSRYEAGRRGASWRKVKPVRTLDLIVLGAEWGHGRRHGWLSNLHLGARDPGDGPPVMVGKTFKGLTDELLTWQTAALLERETSRQGITVFVRPELVVEIALDGVQASTRYPGGVALRFARVKGYRADKGPEDADTIDAVRAMLPGAGSG